MISPLNGMDPGNGIPPHGGAARMRAGEEFWAEFRERARGLPRSGPPRPLAAPAVFFSAVLLLAGVGAALLATRPARASAAIVESLEVDADHSGVVVFQGSGKDPTIVWILDMSADGGNGGS